jgi:transposase
MMGHKIKNLKTYTSFSLEDLVPEDNFYRQVEHGIDLSFVRDLVRHLYSDFGRPSVDPVVFFKLQLIAFFEGIRSERLLMETVSLNLAHRWFIGYDLDESVPDHSSLSKIRERYGLEIFQHFFERIVELCIEAGLVWGEEFFIDATKVRANAAARSMVDRTDAALEHVQQLFGSDTTSTSCNDSESVVSALDLVAKYNGKRIVGSRKPSYKRIADKQISLTDPDAAPMKQSGGGRTVLGYRDHYIVDGGKARIILSALVAPASIMDNTPMLDMVNWTCSRWQLSPTTVTADARYGTAPNIAGLEQAGIKAFVPIPDISKRTKYYHSDLFLYNAEDDHYVCPQGQILKLHARRNSEQVFVYRANAQVCNACSVKHRCTKSKSGRHIFRSFFLEYIERVKGYHETEEYKKSMRKRGVWVEPLFGEAKQFHRLSRFRLRRLKKVNIEGLMVAAGQNLKRLLKFSGNTPFESLIISVSMIETILLDLIDRPWSRSRLNAVKCFSTGWVVYIELAEIKIRRFAKLKCQRLG